MNVELTNTPELEPPVQETPRGLQTDPVLWDYEDCFSNNLVSYQTKYIIFGSWSLSSSNSTIL